MARVEPDTRLAPSAVGERSCAYSTVEFKDRERSALDLSPTIVVAHHNWSDSDVTERKQVFLLMRFGENHGAAPVTIPRMRLDDVAASKSPRLCTALTRD